MWTQYKKERVTFCREQIERQKGQAILLNLFGNKIHITPEDYYETLLESSIDSRTLSEQAFVILKELLLFSLRFLVRFPLICISFIIFGLCYGYISGETFISSLQNTKIMIQENRAHEIFTTYYLGGFMGCIYFMSIFLTLFFNGEVYTRSTKYNMFLKRHLILLSKRVPEIDTIIPRGIPTLWELHRRSELVSIQHNEGDK
jgi:lipid-A-disaccharide synthase-like uncharacterized protein